MVGVFEGRGKAVVVLAAAFIGLAGINMVISQATIDVSPLAVDGASNDFAATGKTINGPSNFTDFDLPQTLERPILSPTRRDYVAVVQEPAPEQAVEDVEEIPVQERVLDVPPISLKGTRYLNGKRSALVAMGEAAAEWVGEGEQIAGWTVRSVTTDGILLETGPQSISFSLYAPVKSAAGGPDE